MNSQIKVTPDLQGVPQTLLLPLLGRAYFTKQGNQLLSDESAVSIANSLNYDFDTLQKDIGGEGMLLWWIARAFHFDNAISEFLKKYPNGVVVNLGAGLDTSFNRVDNGTLTWVDLDMPEVIALREKLIPQNARVHQIAKSLLDFSWMEDVAKLGKHFFFFAGGVFMYFKEEQVKEILVTMANQFPGCELMFDSVGSKGPKYANRMLKDAKMSDARLQWGFDSGEILESWSPRINVVEWFPYFKNIKSKNAFSLKNRLKMLLLDVVSKANLYRIQFK